jgi:hypothetical protein
MRALLVAAGIGIAIVSLAFCTREVWPHDALPTAAQPEGWTYDAGCCSVQDCWRLKHDEIKVVDGGYRIEATQEIVPFNDSRVKRSRDEYYHRCSSAGVVEGYTICLYVPDMGF